MNRYSRYADLSMSIPQPIYTWGGDEMSKNHLSTPISSNRYHISGDTYLADREREKLSAKFLSKECLPSRITQVQPIFGCLESPQLLCSFLPATRQRNNNFWAFCDPSSTHHGHINDKIRCDKEWKLSKKSPRMRFSSLLLPVLHGQDTCHFGQRGGGIR